MCAWATILRYPFMDAFNGSGPNALSDRWNIDFPLVQLAIPSTASTTAARTPTFLYTGPSCAFSSEDAAGVYDAFVADRGRFVDV